MVSLLIAPTLPARIGFLFRRFRRHTKANVAVTFALALLPILGMVGAAIDYARVNNARTAMQAALDSAALMVSKDAPNLTSSQITTTAQAYFKALYTHGEAPPLTFTATYTPNTGKGAIIQLTSSGSMPTEFMKIMGFDNLGFNVASTAKWGQSRLRVALALDNTGSMDYDGKMTALKTAAKNLIDKLSANAKNDGDVYISIVPFAKDVNVGASNSGQSWVRWDIWDQTCWWNCSHSSWNGCVTDRDQDYDTKNMAPGASSTNFPAEQYDSCPTALMPLSYNWSALKSKISAMSPNGGTNQPIGLAWAWMSLTQGAPLNAPALDANYKYDSVIILLSDGANTQNRWPSYGNGNTQFYGRIDARQKLLCDNVKAAGITIYTIQVNTGSPGDPTSSVLQDCASTGKYAMLTTANGIIGKFDEIATQLAKLRIAQ
ncbi:pilus assembly protein [Bradyrhizobium sp. WD16]|uniref:vWA domain-containing protein n=1 Tax=Bradyrhizobium sp. WD16 TaxID=1521768 RepID=UPI0020A2E912|nr:pilus assembly protein [Bradyrhizobium sp. WD16]UTD28782.1 pilus assembly protein TadG [Bradyrhizobium sp. WD16]